MSAPEFKHLSVKEADGIAIVDFVNSELMYETTVVDEVGTELSHVVSDRGYPQILLDFTHVQYLSSTMIAHLAGLGRQVKQAGGRLKLCGLGPILRDTFRIGHLDSLFDIHDDAKAAINSFRS